MTTMLQICASIFDDDKAQSSGSETQGVSTNHQTSNINCSPVRGSGGENVQRSTLNAQRSSFSTNHQPPTINHPMVHGPWFMVHGKTPPTINHSSPTPNSSFLTPNFAARTRAAFTLVETALALLAISLGLLGIFGLARHGLTNAGDTENETRCTLLADTIFETLKAKNNELAANKTSLYDWWVYWFSVLGASQTTAACYLPPLPEIDADAEGIGIFVGQHTLGDSSTPAGEIKWNPIYDLKLTPAFDETSLTSLDSIYAVYERGQIEVTLTLHPGKFQSGAITHTYYTTISYSGGLP